MSDKIIIDLDDIHEEHPSEQKDEGRIVVEFPGEEKKPDSRIEIEEIEESYEAGVRRSNSDFHYKGNPGLCSYFETQLRFPEGIDQGFGMKFQLLLKDDFLTSLLANNRHVIAASRSGTVYFADRFDGVFCDKLSFPNQTFEKSGFVYGNSVYLNSPQKIFRISDKDDLQYEEIYTCKEGNYIWSSLNRKGNYILFTEHNPAARCGRIVALDINNYSAVATDFISDFAGDQLCSSGYGVYSPYRSKLAVMNTDTLAGCGYDINIDCGDAPFVMHMNNRLYITSKANEIFYLDLPAANHNFRTTGIRNTFINSVAGFADNIFIGTQEGWKYYKSSGLQIFSFDDEYENKIEAVCRSMIIISQKNKIVFGNLNRFQEAESFVISAPETILNTEIISAVISHNDVYTLTSNGILTAFTNDKMNIHI